jgi:hypothetical protein
MARLFILMVAAVLAAAGPPVPSPSPSPAMPRIAWSTDVVSLTTQDLLIEAGGRTFTAPPGTWVGWGSDDGDPNYWTLEVEWREQDREMWLYLYFASDGTDWWVSQVRTRNGLEPADWIFYDGPFFRTPLGAAYSGDVDLSSPGPPPGRIRIPGLTLTVQPLTLAEMYAAPPGGGIVATSNPFEPGGPLYCSGILLLPPAQVHERLLALGYRVSYRQAAADPGRDARIRPPVGTVESADVGRYGDIVVFVYVSVPSPTMPADCATPAP